MTVVIDDDDESLIRDTYDDEEPESLHDTYDDEAWISDAEPKMAAEHDGTQTEWEVMEAIRDGKLASPQKYGDFWLFDIRITGTGAAYRQKLDEWAIRNKKEWLSDAFVQRCNGLPVIFEHPKRAGLNDQEWHDRVQRLVGCPE